MLDVENKNNILKNLRKLRNILLSVLGVFLFVASK